MLESCRTSGFDIGPMKPWATVEAMGDLNQDRFHDAPTRLLWHHLDQAGSQEICGLGVFQTRLG